MTQHPREPREANDGSDEYSGLRKKRDKREEILRAAQHAFVEEGYAGASMAMIAARLGGSGG